MEAIRIFTDEKGKKFVQIEIKAAAEDPAIVEELLKMIQAAKEKTITPKKIREGRFR